MPGNGYTQVEKVRLMQYGSIEKTSKRMVAGRLRRKGGRMSIGDFDNRLFQILTNEAFTPEFIAGMAGDRLQGEDEKKLFDLLIKESGNDFYTKLLFFITHEVFEKNKASQLWREILKHKEDLAKQLNRNVEITVATLDYLTNIKSELSNPQLIGATFFGKIAEMSSIDPLTKVYNRQHLNQILESEYLRYNRYKVSFSVALIDIDHFKEVNDTYGHQEGDAVLIRISHEISENLRELDVCARYGGDEFMIVLPHTNITMTYEIAERIREKTEEISNEVKGVTLSIGVACCPWNATTIDALIEAADAALYLSKENGKNRTTIRDK